MKKPVKPEVMLEGRCKDPSVCPLSRVKPGAVVCIKELAATPEISDRLRELGFREDQTIKLLTRDVCYICEVCNARLGISRKLAEAILVEAPSAAVAA